MREPIRVLCIFSTLDRGGAESMCMNLYRNINRKRVQFDFVKHTSKKGDFEEEILEMGGQIFEAPRLTALNLVLYVSWWERHFRKHPEHYIIHGHFFTISPVYFAIAHRHNRLTVGHVHASHINGKYKNWLVSMIASKSDVCLACSEQAGNWVFPNRKFVVLKNALDISLYTFNPKTREEYRKRLNLDNTCFVLGTVANFSAVKNPMGLLKIFECIHKKNKAIKLLWVGDGSFRKEIERTIKEAGLDESVILLGTRSDVPKLLQCIDCFLLPSFNEGLPVSLIEAQAAGLPCYISDTITREVDVTGLCKFLPINNENEWCNNIIEYTGERLDTSSKLKKAGYDVCDTAKWAERFYLKLNEVRR